MGYGSNSTGAVGGYDFNYPGQTTPSAPTTDLSGLGSSGGTATMWNTGSTMGGTLDPNQTISGASNYVNPVTGTIDTSGSSYSPSSSGGGTSGFGNVLSGIGNLAGAVAGPAALIGGATLIGNKLNADASYNANQYRQLAAPVGGLANSELGQATTGKLQPWQQASIDTMVQQERAKAGQFFADTGTGGSQGKAGSTNELGVGTQIDTNALIQQGQFQQQAVSDYLKSFAQYSGLMGDAIKAQIEGDQQVMQLWSSVLGGLAKASAAGSGGGGGGGSSGPGGIGGSGISVGNILGGIGSVANGIENAIGSIFG